MIKIICILRLARERMSFAHTNNNAPVFRGLISPTTLNRQFGFSHWLQYSLFIGTLIYNITSLLLVITNIIKG